jgi:phosphoenolpyruvate carboxykinase (GTP)
MGSETTAAAAGAVGVLRRDPMAMLPFCGYNMGDYFGHWLSMRERITRPPGIFMVNWFRKDGDGKFLWPGYGENLRVLMWILDRMDQKAPAHETAVGSVPNPSSLDLSGLALAPDRLAECLAVKPDEWSAELKSAGEFFDRIGRSMPAELRERHRGIIAALDGAPAERRRAGSAA